MLDLTDLLKRKRAAKARLEDPVLIEAFEACRASARTAFEASSPGDAATREHAYLRLKALDEVEAELASAISDYDMAERRSTSLG